MSRKTTRSFASFLRAYGNDSPEHGFTLAEQLQPVVVVDDASALSKPPPCPEVLTRFYLAALAANYSIGTINAGPAGLRILTLRCVVTGGRVCMRNDGDQIATNRLAVLPPVGTTSTAVMSSALYTGNNTASPEVAGQEFVQFLALDEVHDLVVPANHSLILFGFAVNQVLSFWVHYREGLDG
jgi:hypothetical protein